MSKDGRTWLSHSGVEGLQRCPRCFWLRYNKKIYQPEGIVSRLANRFDSVLKNYFSIYRQIDQMPPMVKGKLPGKLQKPFIEKYFVRINDKYGFYGLLDECLVNEKGEHTPVDFKTSSTDPREKDTLPAYKAQVDAYTFLLEQNNKKISGDGYLVYVYPDLGKELHAGFPMVIHIQKLPGDPERTKKRIKKAIEVIEEEIPEASIDCPFCAYRDTVGETIKDL